MIWIKQSVLFLIVPFIIFCFGFLRWYVGIPMIVFSVYCCYKVCAVFETDKNILTNTQHFLLAIVSLLWCWHCGIGGFWVQHSDFFVKNAILRDLINRPWPLRYDLSSMSMDVQQMIGGDEVSFVYYLFSYLPAAFLGWLFKSEIIGNITLLLWSAWGIYLVLRFIFNWVCKDTPSYRAYGAILFATIFFSGLEVIGVPLLDLCLGNDFIGNTWNNIKSLSIAKEMWCSSYFSMYGSLYSDMEIRFNQTIPIWVVMSLVCQSKDFRHLGFFFSFLLLYSPWACIGLFLMIVYIVFVDTLKHGWNRIVTYLNTESILFPLLLLLIVGSYYSSNQNAVSCQGWFFEYLSSQEFLVMYILFIFIEIGAYFFFLRKELKDNILLQASFVLLLVLPFYRMTDANDLLMCASIPAIFIIAVNWVLWLNRHFVGKMRIVLCLFLLLTSLTPIEWMIAEDYHFLSGRTVMIKDYIHSFQEVKGEHVTLCEQQFFAHGYQETFFWKYLAQ